MICDELTKILLQISSNCYDLRLLVRCFLDEEMTQEEFFKAQDLACSIQDGVQVLGDILKK